MFRIPEQPGLEPLKFTCEIEGVIRIEGIGINGGVDLKSLKDEPPRGGRIRTGGRSGKREKRRGSRKTQHNNTTFQLAEDSEAASFFR